MRAELKVTAVNAYIQLLSDKGEPEGDKLAEYVFEEDEDRLISIYVCAEVPGSYEIDYWLIGGVPYHFNKTVSSMKVYDLGAPETYEVVFKVDTVKVTCTNCTFSGGGYKNATSGNVPKGTKITVTGKTAVANPVAWEINGNLNTSYMGMTTITYTVNKNTTFKYTGFN
jgi:hypothetical protein